MKIIYKNKTFRIIEIEDECYNIGDLEGDSYNPECNPDIDPKKLEKEQSEFRTKVDSEGVFGYLLEYWNPDVDRGWTSMDSCFGFIGQYDEKNEEYNHYIVKEMKQTIKRSLVDE